MKLTDLTSGGIRTRDLAISSSSYGLYVPVQEQLVMYSAYPAMNVISRWVVM